MQLFSDNDVQRKSPILYSDSKDDERSLMFPSYDSRLESANQMLGEYPLLYPKRVAYVAEGQAPVRKLQAEMLTDDPLFAIARKKFL